MLNITNLNGFNAGQNKARVSYVTQTSSTATTATITFSSVSFGEELGRSLVVVVACMRGSTARTINSATIAGSAATKVVGSASSNSSTAIFSFPATGTSGNIAITLSGTSTGIGIAVYALYNLKNTISVATNSATGTTGTSLSSDINTNAGGVAVAVGATRGGPPTFTWTGLTENFDLVYAGNDAYSGASINNNEYSSPLLVSFTLSVAPGTSSSICSASWS